MLHSFILVGLDEFRRACEHDSGDVDWADYPLGTCPHSFVTFTSLELTASPPGGVAVSATPADGVEVSASPPDDVAVSATSPGGVAVSATSPDGVAVSACPLFDVECASHVEARYCSPCVSYCAR